ncbi:phosphoribosylglycinamide formyltransferase [Thiomicrospira microaerophila]|uniref:phosphoribosylglycinamide formyltransferase n=1 Tax=Thiomicrospira microaerophila TaxID=406020 RepID=UPI0005C9FE05|nr:phosphoribosylglycinamide formyltransferase [Thiomicrospira microaerophila]
MVRELTNVVVVLSGNGSNLQALIDFQQRADCAYKIVKVVANRPNAFGLERAKQHHIPASLVNHQDYATREDFERALIQHIDQAQPGLVVLAGFMRILTPLFTEHYLGKMLNIHPSLLPKYPGLDTHQRAIDAGDTEHGLSIHFVTAELDGGPVILQASLKIEPQMDAQMLQQQVHQLEHQAYPLAVNLFAQGQLSLQDNQAWLNHQALIQPLKLSDLQHV